MLVNRVAFWLDARAKEQSNEKNIITREAARSHFFKWAIENGTSGKDRRYVRFRRETNQCAAGMISIHAL